MQIYIDTASIEDIRAAADMGVLDGVTTNPSLVAKEGVDFTTDSRRSARSCPAPSPPKWSPPNRTP